MWSMSRRNVTQGTDGHGEGEAAAGPLRALYVFRADWCPHCRVVSKAGTIAAFRKARPDVVVLVEDVTRGITDAAKTFGIRMVPTYVVVGERGQVLRRLHGVVTVEQLERATR